VTDFAKLILDADTTGLKRGQNDLQSLGSQAKRTAADVSSLQQGFGAAGVGVLGFMGGARRVKEEMNAVTTATGAQRAGMQQLGYQIGDVATMYSLGAKPAQIFASQIGQITQAVQLMTGGTSRFAAFLGGPWGIALSAGAIVMAPFIGKLWETYGAANAATGALEGLIQKQRQQQAEARKVINSEKDLNGLIKQRNELLARIDKVGGAVRPDGTRENVYKEEQALKAVNKQIMEGRAALDAERASAAGLSDIMGKVAVTSAATGETMSKSFGGGAKSATASIKPLQNTMESALDTLTRFKREMRDTGLFSSQAVMSDATRQIRADDAPPEQDMDKLNYGLTQLQDRMDALKDKAADTTAGIRDSFRQMATDALNSLDRLAGAIQGGNFLSILSGVLNFGLQLGGMGVFGKSVQTNINAQPRANGGNVSAGQSYLVGENRPEMFVPDTNGRIIPQVGGGATRVLVEASPFFDVRVDGRIQTAAPAIADAGANVAQTRMGRSATRRVA
jgi:hypothetical protein